MRVLNSPFLTEFKVFYQLSVCGQTENQQKAIQNKVTKPFVEVLYMFFFFIFLRILSVRQGHNLLLKKMFSKLEVQRRLGQLMSKHLWTIPDKKLVKERKSSKIGHYQKTFISAFHSFFQPASLRQTSSPSYSFIPLLGRTATKSSNHWIL